MKPPEYYSDNPQTYVKHFFLENYLERVAYNIFSFKRDFVYVDGFSGPWKSKDQAYEDTSFIIALNKLRNVREGMEQQGKKVKVRCLFIEKEPEIFEKLEEAVNSISDIEIKPLCGSFEDLVSEVIPFIGKSFSLVFIDPKGWKGYALEKISPLLQLRGEVLINFMTDYFNRFIEHPRPETARTFDPVFGDPSWYDDFMVRVGEGQPREEAILGVYLDRLRKAGHFKHVTSTKIKKPYADRSFFHLVYGTRSWKGPLEFRAVEKKAAPVQEQVRGLAKSKASYERRKLKTGMDDFFGSNEQDVDLSSLEHERIQRLNEGRKEFELLLKTNTRIKYEDLVGKVSERPLVWKSDIDEWIKNKKGAEEVLIEGMGPREKTPKPGHIIVRKN